MDFRKTWSYQIMSTQISKCSFRHLVVGKWNLKEKFFCNSRFWSNPANIPTPYPLAFVPLLLPLPRLHQLQQTAEMKQVKAEEWHSRETETALNKVLGHKKFSASIERKIPQFCILDPASHLNTLIIFLRQDDDTLYCSVLLSGSCTWFPCYRLQGAWALSKTETLTRIFSFT